MERHQVCPAELNDAAIDRYLTTLAQSPKPPSGDRKKEIAGVLHALLRYLRRQGVIAHPEPPPLTITQQWVVKYDAYLDRIADLAPTTRKKYLYFAGRRDHALLLTLYNTDELGNSLIFPSVRGRPLTRSGVNYILQQAVSTASDKQPSLHDKKISPHSMRLSTAMHLLQSGVDIR
jgi:integrase